MAPVTWSPRSVLDLAEACDYMSRTSDKYAQRFAEQIVALVEAIPQMPRLGAKVPEYDRDDLRERLLDNYRIVYRIRRDEIEVVTIWRGSRPLRPLHELLD